MFAPMTIKTMLRRCAGKFALLSALSLTTATGPLLAQEPAPPLVPTPEAEAKARALISEVVESEVPLKIDPRSSKLIRTKRPVSRFSVTNPSVLDIVQFSPTEFELIGGQTGETSLTLWFGDDVLRYLVTVGIDEGELDRKIVEYGKLQDRINELFPNSQLQLIPVADKLIVRGQCRDSEEAAQILAILGSYQTDQTGRLLGPGSTPVTAIGQATFPNPSSTDLTASNIVNLLEVPGEQQVMLKVRVASLTRAAGRGMGGTFFAPVSSPSFRFNSGQGGPLALPGGPTAGVGVVLSTEDVFLALSATATNSYGKVLAEPNLVTISGRPATFSSGGEFAVPIVVGVQGAAAATTNFRSFGTQLAFTPTVIDRDRIRLTVSPSISSPSGGSVGGIPSLSSTFVTTTVDLREGQWLALGGMITETQGGSKGRTPILGDIPILDAFFSQKSIEREETELIILCSPELIHPLEADQTPLILPGMEVTEPGDWDFYIWGKTEGEPGNHHRSTLKPVQHWRIHEARGRAVKNAYETRRRSDYQTSEGYYIQGNSGFSQ